MKILDKVFIWLSMCDIDFTTLYDLFHTYPNIENLWYLDKYAGQIIYHLTGSEYRDLMKVRDSGLLDKVIDELDGESAKIKYVCLYQPEYPDNLRELDFPPFVLYYIGDLSLAKGRNVAIVGSRSCTRYGREQTERFARELGQNGFAIVSGLSEGIDAVAHETALKNNCKTIAVVANGLKSIFPAINTNLAREIVKSGGLLLSEFYPDYVPKSFAFVQRNRIIAGLCEGTLVTEARKDSGALHTANFALDLNRNVFAIPGNCNSYASEGTNDLIKSFNTVCVTSPKEIVDTLNRDILYRQIINENQKPIARIDKLVNLNEDESKVVELLNKDDAHFDEIAEFLSFSTKKLLVLLTTLEIRGLIKKLPGNYYAKKD